LIYVFFKDFCWYIYGTFCWFNLDLVRRRNSNAGTCWRGDKLKLQVHSLISSLLSLFLKLLHPCWDFSLQIYLAYLPGVSHDITACMIHKMSLVLLIPRCSVYFCAFLIAGNFENFVQISIIYQMKPYLSNSNISYLR